MATVTIPIRTLHPHFDFVVELEGASYTVELQWNDRAERWFISLYDATNAPIFSGATLVCNWDLLRRSVHPQRPPGQFFALSPSGLDPTYEDLYSNEVTLVYVEAGA